MEDSSSAPLVLLLRRNVFMAEAFGGRIRNRDKRSQRDGLGDSVYFGVLSGKLRDEYLEDEERYVVEYGQQQGGRGKLSKGNPA